MGGIAVPLAPFDAAFGGSAAVVKGDSVFTATPDERRAAEGEDNELRIVYVLSWGRGGSHGASDSSTMSPVPDVSPEEGARALLDKAVSDKSTFAMRCRAISCVFRLLPTSTIDAMYR